MKRGCLRIDQAQNIGLLSERKSGNGKPLRTDSCHHVAESRKGKCGNGRKRLRKAWVNGLNAFDCKRELLAISHFRGHAYLWLGQWRDFFVAEVKEVRDDRKKAVDMFGCDPKNSIVSK